MKYFIKTFGCQMNESDSERIASFLDSLGLEDLKKEKSADVSAKKLTKADLVIFNTCGVRQTAEDRVYGQVHNLRKVSPDTKIVITGCVAHRKDVQKKLKDKVDLFVETNKLLNKLPEFLKKESQITDYKLPITKKENNECNYLKLTPKYQKPSSAFVPIMTGCNNFCSYCVVPYARGREKSRPVQEIFKEIKNLSKNDCKEVTLLGQNVNSYSCENSNSKLVIGENKENPNYKLQITNYKTITFPILLNLLTKTYPKISWHFLTSHPKDFSEDLMKVIAENKNISKEIHLPVQSGSDKILKAMNRPYTKKHYLDLIKKAKKIIPDVTFTTDVIVGFPGETEKDFQETVKVFKKVEYTEAYINKYSPRPETAALKLGDPIAWNEKKRREKHLRQFIKK